MHIRALEPGDKPEWVRMRCALWPDEPPEELEEEAGRFFSGSGPADLSMVLVAVRPEGGLCGLAELSLRNIVDGATSTPVGYLEGWYVDPDHRRSGLGRALVEAGEAWARERGCAEMGSDVEIDNDISQRAHDGMGYGEISRVVTYVKRLR